MPSLNFLVRYTRDEHKVFNPETRKVVGTRNLKFIERLVYKGVFFVEDLQKDFETEQIEELMQRNDEIYADEGESNVQTEIEKGRPPKNKPSDGTLCSQ